MIGNPGTAEECGNTWNGVHPAPAFRPGITAVNVPARAFEEFGIGMKGEIDEAMSLFLRERDKIGKQDQAVRQPSTPESDGEPLLFFKSNQRGRGFRSGRASRFSVGRRRHREMA